jgi:hypothetical protein
MGKTGYCPLAKDKCVGKSCMWYVVGLDECAVKTLAQATDSLADTIADAIEDREDED